MADNASYFLDQREPHASITEAGLLAGAITLAASYKALHLKDDFPVLGAQYFARLGKRVRVRAMGKMTTGATPGNIQLALYYGTGADANGAKIAETVARALVANASGKPWIAEFDITAVTLGSSGKLNACGWTLFDVALVLGTVGPIILPPTASGSLATADLTAANVLSLQALRSGSTAETMTVEDICVLALN